MHFRDFRSVDRKRSDFEAVGNNFFAWVLSAQELLASANILQRQCATRRFFPSDLEKFEDELTSEGGKVFRVILMLWGMAAECLLKAMWLKCGGRLVAGGSYQKIPHTNDHALDTLAEQVSAKASFPFSEEEKDLLCRLSLFIVLGRYPIPKDVIARTRRAPKGMETGGWSITHDDELFGRLCWRMFEELRK